MPDQPMTYDEEAALYANLFARAGYTFLGWTADPNEVEEVSCCDGVVVENLTDEVDGEFDLYAIRAANGCTVSGLPTGMKWTAKDVKAKDGSVTTPANSICGIPTKPGRYTVYFKKSVSEINEQGRSVKVTHTATATFEVADYPTITLLPSLAIAGSEPWQRQSRRPRRYGA